MMTDKDTPMLERMKRAIKSVHGYTGTRDRTADEMAEEQVRAALTELLTPTEAMKLAALDAVGVYAAFDRCSPKDAYEAMIRTALGEET